MTTIQFHGTKMNGIIVYYPQIASLLVLQLKLGQKTLNFRSLYLTLRPHTRRGHTCAMNP